MYVLLPSAGTNFIKLYSSPGQELENRGEIAWNGVVHVYFATHIVTLCFLVLIMWTRTVVNGLEIALYLQGRKRKEDPRSRAPRASEKRGRYISFVDGCSQ